MNSVDETFDETELDEASNVYVIQDRKVLVEVELQPFLPDG